MNRLLLRGALAPRASWWPMSAGLPSLLFGTSAGSTLPLAQQCSFATRAKPAQKVTAVLGAQWGDEGKGKLVDILAKRFDIVARFNGGANAGHTLVVNRKKYAFHLLPCGMLYPEKVNVIGNGVVLHLPTLFDELDKIKDRVQNLPKQLVVSDRAHLLFDFYPLIDGMQEKALDSQGIGTTRRGIGPCYSSKMTRDSLRVGMMRHWDTFEASYWKLLGSLQQKYGFEYNGQEELNRLRDYSHQLKDMITDTVVYLNHSLQEGKSVLAEGANAALLDIDFGTYPYVTSSSTSAGGICTGLGIAPSKVGKVVGVAKAYTTRVGAGPFPTELNDSIGEQLRDKGGEFGTTTGRPRRCGWMDIPVLQYSQLLNNYSSINLTKLDVLSDLPELKIGVAYHYNGQRLPVGAMPSTLENLGRVEVEYETLPGWQQDISGVRKFNDLPPQAIQYVKRVSELLGVPVSFVGVGPSRGAMLKNPSGPRL